MLGLAGGELILVAVVALVLFSANYFPPFFLGLKRGIREFLKASRGIEIPFDVPTRPPVWPVADALTHTNQTVECDPPPEPELERSNPLVLWIAQGFGAGRLKPGPGTWGSAVGLIWFALLVATGSLWSYFGSILISIPFSVWVCGLAEKFLREKDPGSVVLDEIIALPLCFSAWVLAVTNDTGQMPTVVHFVSGNRLLGVIAVFAAFRLFDIWKPWPVRQSQSLPGGWGVTVDDILAALYVNLVSLPFLL